MTEKKTRNKVDPVKKWQRRIVEIDEEVERHSTLQERAERELSGLVKNLKERKVEQREEIRNQLAVSFSEKSDGGTLDDVYKMPMVSREHLQLSENIERLQETIRWNEDETRRLKREKQDLLQAIVDHQLKCNIQDVYALKNAFIKSFQDCEEQLEKLKGGMMRCFQLDRKWCTKLSSSDSELHTNDKFIIRFFDQFKPENMHAITIVSLLDKVSRWGNQFGLNPFFVDATGRPNYQMTPTDIMRDSFEDGGFVIH